MSYKNGDVRLVRGVKDLELGCLYHVYYPTKKPVVHKFIKVTKKGYNFLNIETNKCILKQHLYESKKYKNTFFVYKMLIIEEI